jgi:hypothetical protein
MDNHFVPEFYFGPWLDARGHLVQFGWRPRGLVGDLKTAGQICYRRDLHTLNELISPEKRDVVEHWLTREIDSQAAPVIKTILASGIVAIDGRDAGRLAHFIMSLIVRRPESVELLRSEAPTEFARNLEHRDEAIRQELRCAGVTEAPTLLEYAQRHRPGMIENFGNLLISPIVADRKRAEWLLRRRWWAVDYDGTSVVPQITSDRGVTCLGIALDDPRSMVILPLSPRHVLYITSEQDQARLQTLGRGLLGLSTIKAVAGNARRFVYGTKEANQNLIRKYLARSASPSGS